MSWKPELCEACLTPGAARAHCPTFPRPCEDLIEIYESGVADERERCAKIAHLALDVDDAVAKIRSGK